MKRLLHGLLIAAALMGFNANADTGVSRSAFTTSIQDREPTDQVEKLTADHDKIYFFTEIRGMAGHTVSHKWMYNGQEMANVSFNIGADRWRTWSSKTMQPSWLGKWTVDVVDEGGNVLAQESFEYVAADEMAKPAEAGGDMPADDTAGDSMPAKDDAADSMPAKEAAPESMPANQ